MKGHVYVVGTKYENKYLIEYGMSYPDLFLFEANDLSLSWAGKDKGQEDQITV